MDAKTINGIITKNERTVNEGPLALTGVYHLLDPAVSQAQREFVYAHFGPAWAARHHYNNKGHLPARKGK